MYLFRTLAIPKSPSCTVPSLVRNMFCTRMKKREQCRALAKTMRSGWGKQYLWLDVPVQNLATMHVFERQTNLHKPVQDLWGERSRSAPALLLAEMTTAWFDQNKESNHALLGLQRKALLSESWSSWTGLRPHSSPLQCTNNRPLENTKQQHCAGYLKFSQLSQTSFIYKYAVFSQIRFSRT